MKIFLFLAILIAWSKAFAGTCTSISRTNAASLSVLTSSKYNGDLNTAYTFANAYDAGCITSGTLESDALNTTQFAPLLKGLKEGCKVSYTNASTLSISTCLAGVNGNFINKSTATSVAFGCSGCSAEVSTTQYYVYIQTGSSGSTITPLILTGAPNADGYDGSGNRVLARFYNNGGGDIDQYSIDQWLVNGFVSSNTGWTLYTPTFLNFGTVSTTNLYFRRQGQNIEIQGRFLCGVSAGAEARVYFPGVHMLTTAVAGGVQNTGSYFKGGATSTAHGGAILSVLNYGFMVFGSRDTYGNGNIDPHAPINGNAACSTGEAITIQASVPISGWNE